ncbi:SusC/RagA family TonB-linked outer membrane protein [Pricia sp. S334]|uniref:SusC/RagA family TonB-linked outer membrane protein n=1 Tax=Pricia mediterranea TaxID=3076079 RepID=A0ABU3L3W8_9FLAO|nr:SusC/RagA family TonB-linked outer membrane protein [Pricia sp. S334]MDT7827948.1 SusC/RagA family TonB-linked outer membrane protein [Pricia sp. S334]
MRARHKGLLTLLLALVVQLSFAQEKTVTGTVTDQNELPLPGVNIVVQGTTTGTQTDFDGNYSINAEEGQVLVFTYIGQKAVEQGVGDGNVIDVQMEEDAQALEEVVVTALGVNRDEKSLTYSAPQVNSEELLSAQNDNAVGALSSKVAGLQVNSPSGNLGGSQRILIRGANSVTGENQPLFVVDGIPMDNSGFNTTDAQRGAGGVDFGSTINDINPNNIESVTVLKGTAAALYGSRASNGVVLIKTKTGEASDKLGVSINSSVSFSQVAVLPDLQREYGGGAIITGEDSDGGFATANINGTTYRLADYHTDESWGPKYDPNLMVLHWDAFDQESFPEDYLRPRPWVAPANDVETFFNTGITYRNDITLSSGGEKGNYLFSFGSQNQTGIVPNTEIEKYSAKVSLTQNLSEKLTANSIINYTVSRGKRPTIGYDDNSVTQKFFQWGQRQLDYDRLRKYKNEDGTQRTWNRISWDDATPNYSDNPYWTVYENYPTDNRTRVFGNFGLNYQVSDELSVKGTVYGDTYHFENKERQSIGSQAQSLYRERNYDYSEYNYELVANYNKDFSDNFSLGALVGGNKRDYQLSFVRNETTGGLSLPGIFNIANGLGQLDKDTYTDKKKVNSLFASLNLAIYDQLFFDFTARNDWSSALPDNNNSYFYPSASLAWAFSDTFIQDSQWFNYGKLRVGWAQVGNDTDPYRAVNTLTIDNPFNNTGRVTVPSTRLNSELKSETTTTWEAGAELSFFKNRLNLDVTYYQNETVDQIIPIDLSFGTGYGSQYVNAGKMTNEGVEIAVGITPVRTENFKWQIDGTFAKNESELVELIDGLNSILLTNAPFQAQLAAYVGAPYGQIMGTDFIYDSEGNKVVTAGGAYAATSDIVPIGSTLPDYTAGLRNAFQYKNVDLSFLLGMSKGGKYFSTSHMWGMYSGMLEKTVANNIREDGIVLEGVTGTVTYNADGSYTVTDTAPNTTNVSAQAYGGNHYGGFGTPDAQNVFDADYFKLREVTVGYTFPKQIFDFFDTARVSLFGRNLLIWGLDYDGIDPETVSTGSGNIQGLEGGLQPSTRSYGMNVQLSF